MKDLRQLLSKKRIGTRAPLDEKSIFFVFNKVIQDEYGKQGSQSIQPVFLKEKKIFVKTTSSNWANEIWLSKAQLVQKVNNEIGQGEIIDIAISQ